MSANVYQLVSHDYVTGAKQGLNVGRKPASQFALGERWSYEYQSETYQSVTSKVCVKHATKYVYFAFRMEDVAFASRITKVAKTELLAYSLGQEPYVIVEPRPRYNPARVVSEAEQAATWDRIDAMIVARMAVVAPAPVAPAPAPVVAQPTSDTCPVCLTDYDIKDMAETVCHHNFCDACAMKLYRTGATACPMCRAALRFRIGAR